MLGIIQSDALFVSSIRHLTDATELNYAIDIASRELRTIAVNEAFSAPLMKEYCESSLKSIAYAQFVERFVGSFSEEADLLSQWRAYSEGGVGFSIGFDYVRLGRLAERQQFSLVRCTYDNRYHTTAMQGTIRKHARGLKRDSATSCALRCLQAFMEMAPTLKHPSFAEEKEWRLVNKTVRRPVLFRTGKSMLIPYQEFKLQSKTGLSPIADIVVGPTPHMGLSVESVERLLNVSGMTHVLVRQSTVPFRNW
jgi:hypothetical protein